MSATLIDGGPAGPDEVGDPYRNRVETDRALWWVAAGSRQGVRRGFVASVVPGQMAVSYSAGFGLVEERTSLGALGTGRGYAVWSDADELASFGPASASTRVDAVVLAFVDVAAGAAALGTETSTVGGQIVVVPGVSGTTTPRTDSQISAAVGSGGWVRRHDVTIPSGSTQITSGNMAAADVYPQTWRTVTAYNAGWSGDLAYRLINGVIFMRGSATRASGTGTSPTTLPVGFRPETVWNTITRLNVNDGIGVNVDAAGVVNISSVVTNGAPVYFNNITYPVA